MNVPVDIADLRVEDLVVHISSGTVSPGAGSAGAVALALAAACASKAVSVTLKHRPDDLELRSALACFTKIARFALIDSDRDSEAFKEFVRERNPAAVERLVSEGENVARLIAALETAIDEIDAKIMPNMTGDLVAAKALIAAARSIQESNEGEALQLR
jgi:formiminotetrahydrofolate cyclodeaminase